MNSELYTLPGIRQFRDGSSLYFTQITNNSCVTRLFRHNVLLPHQYVKLIEGDSIYCLCLNNDEFNTISSFTFTHYKVVNLNTKHNCIKVFSLKILTESDIELFPDFPSYHWFVQKFIHF